MPSDKSISNYEILELVPGSGHMYRVRNAYSPILAELALKEQNRVARIELAKETGIDPYSPAALSITDEQADRWLNFNCYYIDHLDKIPKLKPVSDGKGGLKRGDDGKTLFEAEKDVNGDPIMIPTIKLRDNQPIALVKCAVGMICEPIGNAPHPLVNFLDIDEGVLAKVIRFFIISIGHTPEIEKKNPESSLNSKPSGKDENSSSETESSSN